MNGDGRVVYPATGRLLKDPDAAVDVGSQAEPVPWTTEDVLEHLGKDTS